MKNKIDKGSILFILYALWHSVVVAVFAESSASIIVRIILLIGIGAVDIFLFYNSYQQSKEKEKYFELKCRYERELEWYKNQHRIDSEYLRLYLEQLDKEETNVMQKM